MDTGLDAKGHVGRWRAASVALEISAEPPGRQDRIISMCEVGSPIKKIDNNQSRGLKPELVVHPAVAAVITVRSELGSRSPGRRTW
jgi:hypothetical protein